MSELMNFNAADIDEMAESLLSPSDSGFGTLLSESDSDADLPDEPTVDLLKIMDYNDNEEPITLPRSMLLCEADCGHCSDKVDLKTTGNKDPFMGIASHNHSCSDSHPHSSILGQIMSPLEEQSCPLLTPKKEVFSAWDHTSVNIKKEVFSGWDHAATNVDDYQGYTKSSFIKEEDFSEDTAFPDTSSTFSDNGVTGDDSDVDIETVTETPRSLSIFSGSSLDCSPLSTPSGSPTPMQNFESKGSLMTILSSSSVSPKILSSSSTKSLLHGISSSASLAENLMVGRPCISGHKRKQLEKQKKFTFHPKPTIRMSTHQPGYSHILTNSNSVNFHDYAMSPSEDTSQSVETGRPTVLQKRMYRKRQYAQSFDISDKEKQHHHNQLERNRRQKLADLFTDLRDEIPKIEQHSKASKVVILNEATEYITELQHLDNMQENEIVNLIQKQSDLEKKLRQLQSQRSSFH